MSVFNFRASAKKCIGFIKEQNRVRAFRGIKETPKVLLGFPDILARDSRQNDAVQVETKFVCDDFGYHSFAGAGMSREKNTQPPPRVTAT